MYIYICRQSIVPKLFANEYVKKKVGALGTSVYLPKCRSDGLQTPNV
jgi:hypothetical protein